MYIKECFVSHNGVSCITNIDKLRNIYFSNIKKNIILYMSLRITEFIIVDFLNNKHFINKINENNDFLLTHIIFN